MRTQTKQAQQFSLATSLLVLTLLVGAADAADAPGALAGRTSFEGTPPAPREIAVSKDATECKHAAGAVQDVVVAADKSLAGVVVEILGIKQEGAWEWKHPEGGYAIRQKDCRFTPSQLVIPSGAEVLIYNDDPVLHNINTGQWNVAQPGKTDRPAKQKIRYAGQAFVRANCNVHSWMEAWIYVARSPFYAATGADGKFKIENVPPGAYKITASHPTLGTQKFEVTIASGQTATHDLTFRSR